MQHSSHSQHIRQNGCVNSLKVPHPSEASSPSRDELYGDREPLEAQQGRLNLDQYFQLALGIFLRSESTFPGTPRLDDARDSSYADSEGRVFLNNSS